MSASGTQLEQKTRVLRRARRLVVKVGSNVLAGPRGVNAARVRALGADVARLVAAGR